MAWSKEFKKEVERDIRKMQREQLNPRINKKTVLGALGGVGFLANPAAAPLISHGFIVEAQPKTAEVADAPESVLSTQAASGLLDIYEKLDNRFKIKLSDHKVVREIKEELGQENVSGGLSEVAKANKAGLLDTALLSAGILRNEDGLVIFEVNSEEKDGVSERPISALEASEKVLSEIAVTVAYTLSNGKPKTNTIGTALVGLTKAAGMAAESTSFSAENTERTVSGNEAMSAPAVERAVAAEIPAEVITFIQESEAQGKIPIHHGSNGWPLIAGPILRELGYPDDVVEAASSLRSFRQLAERFPGMVFNKHKLRPVEYLNPRGDSESLWVASQRPGAAAEIGTGYQMASDYANRLMAWRTFDPNVASRIASTLQTEMADLKVLIDSKAATTDQIVRYDRLSFELNFNQQRLDLYNKMQTQLGGKANLVIESMRTPIVLESQLDPSELMYRNDPNNMTAIVNQGELPFSKVTKAYYSANANPKVIELLKQYHPEINFIPDPNIRSDNMFTRMPLDKYAQMYKVGQNADKTLAYMPLMGIVSLAAGPVGIAAVDLTESSMDWVAQKDSGRTDMSLDEFLEYRDKTFVNKLAQVDDGLGNSMYEPLINFVEEQKNEPNDWQGYSLPINTPVQVDMTVPTGTPVVAPVAVGEKNFLGLTPVVNGVGSVSENQTYDTFTFTYRGSNGTGPIIEVLNSKGQPVNAADVPGVGKFFQFFGPEGQLIKINNDQGPEVIPAFLYRYAFMQEGTVDLVLKPEIVAVQPKQ